MKLLEWWSQIANKLGLGFKLWQLFFPSHLNDATKWEYVAVIMALVVHRLAVEGSELYCYNTEGERNSVVSQLTCRMDVTQLEQCVLFLLHFEKTLLNLLEF